MKVKIRYKSIIKYDEHQETIEYQETGEYLINDSGFSLEFTSQGNKIAIEQRDEQIFLTNNQATLVVAYQKLLNDYQTPYGSIELESDLLLFEYRKPNLKIKYQLSKDEVKISDIFIVVNIIEGEAVDENIQDIN